MDAGRIQIGDGGCWSLIGCWDWVDERCLLILTVYGWYIVGER